MSGNSAFVLVNERGWRRGLGNLLSNEFAAWWKTKMWWIQCLIWGAVVGFMLGAIIFGSPDFELDEALFIYSIFAGMFPAVAVVIIMQDAIVGEKQEGTAAWVLSKPVSRPAFILSKLAANSVGVLATMVVFPGVIAFALLSFAAKAPLDLSRFLPALGVIFLNHLFYLALTLMLGTVFRGRGPVIGISLAFLFMQQYLVGLLPVLKYVLPWTLVIPLNNQNDAIVPALLTGQPPFSLIPLVAVGIEILVFVWIALVRFEREEF
ncbi:MAG: ABC transporter permease [Anaerolineales bacterium]|nr:ABC transporter permease [Anaerolineales bacterium]